MRLKWGQEYVGTLEACDEYMNFRLSSARECVRGDGVWGDCGDMFIRCNNVLFVRSLDGVDVGAATVQ